MKTNRPIFISVLIVALSLQSFAAVTPPPSTLALQAAAMAEQAAALAQQAVLASQAAAAQEAAQRYASQQPTVAGPQAGTIPPANSPQAAAPATPAAIQPQAVVPQVPVPQAVTAPQIPAPQAAVPQVPVPQAVRAPQTPVTQAANIPQAATAPPAVVLPQTVPLVNASSIPSQTPQTGAVSAPVTPVQLLQCSCPADKTPVMFAGLCICGTCPKVSDAVAVYNKQCPDSKFTEFNAGLEKNCKEIENTEDCEFFKKSPGGLTDDYKRCRDMLDSIQDDCENATACCSTMVVPGAKEAED